MMNKVQISFCKLWIAAALLSLIFGIGSTAIAANISTTNVNKIPEIISGERGRPTVVIIFSSRCPLSQNFWPRFLEFAKNNIGKNVSFLGFSTDKDQNNVTDFVSRYDLPFNCYWIEPYTRGTLAASIRTLGIQVGDSFTIPLVVVHDSNGHVVGQWQGLQEISPITNVLKKIGIS
jgi:thioredoxin-like negative regulator of GroEL